MDNKYKALSYLPPKPINIKQRFGKLTLATCTSAEKTKATLAPKLSTAPKPSTASSSSSKKLLYTYINPNNNDAKISDDSLITDDDNDSADDNYLSGSERNKIINNILNSDDTTISENPMNDQPIRHNNKNNCDDEKSQFSEKLLLNDSNQTNCNSILPSQSVKKKSSTPLFSTTSDTIVSRLSSQLDRLGLNDLRNLPDDIKIRNSVDARDSPMVKAESAVNDNPDLSITNVSILTISSTVSDYETENDTDNENNSGSESDVIILSSDDEVEKNNDNRGSSESEIEKNVSSLSHTSNDSLNTQVKHKLSNFFNNIPSPKSPERFGSVTERQNCVPETPENMEIIPETPENLSLNNVDTPELEPIINTDSSVVKINSPALSNPNITTNEAEDTHVSINISTKIQINIQISDLEKYRRESTDSESGSEKPQQKNSPVNLDKTNSQVENENELKESVQEHVSTEKDPSTNKFVGLNQTDLEIDEEMECILNELYGKAWQTPQLLEKCLSTKKTVYKPPQEKAIEQIDDTDFSLFGKKINDELESTRLPEQINFETKSGNKPKTAAKKKKTATKTVTNQKHQDSSSDETEPHHHPGRRLSFSNAGRPKRLVVRNRIKICDSDTSESSCGNGSDSDLNFTINVNEVDDDSEDEKENRRNRNIGKVLDRYEYTKKPGILATPTLTYELPVTKKIGNSKRKLYTPQDHEMPLPEETPPPKPDRSREEYSLKQISEWITLKNKKIDEVKKCDLFVTPKCSTATKKKVQTTSKSTIKSKPVEVKSDQNYGFLQSLDEKISKEFCHQDAIKYRDNYAKNKIELVDKLYELYNDQIFNFPDKIDVTWHKKLTKTAGRCLTKRKNGERTCRIELSEKVLTSAGRLRCTMVHELCHAATWIFDGDNGHGIRWKAWASKSMKVFPELPKIEICHAYEIEYKYTYKCMQCNAKQQAHSKSIKVDNKCCKFCHGKIEVFMNKKTNDGAIIHTPIRAVSGFAKFVQENYKIHKKDGVKHADVMKILSSKFGEMGLAKH